MCAKVHVFDNRMVPNRPRRRKVGNVRTGGNLFGKHVSLRLLLPATYSVGLSCVLSPCLQRTTERLVGQLLIRSIVRAQAHETRHSRSCREVAPGSESQMAARIRSRMAVSARSLAGLYPKLYDLGQGGGRTSHWLRK